MNGSNHLKGFWVAILLLSLLLPVTTFAAEIEELQPVFEFPKLGETSKHGLELNSLSAPIGEIETAKSLRVFTNENQTVKSTPPGQKIEKFSWQILPPASETGRSPLSNHSPRSGKPLLLLAVAGLTLAGTALLARFFLKRPD